MPSLNHLYVHWEWPLCFPVHEQLISHSHQALLCRTSLATLVFRPCLTSRCRIIAQMSLFYNKTKQFVHLAVIFFHRTLHRMFLLSKCVGQSSLSCGNTFPCSTDTLQFLTSCLLDRRHIKVPQNKIWYTKYVGNKKI